MLASWPGQSYALVEPAHLSLRACDAQAREQLGQTYFYTYGSGHLALSLRTFASGTVVRGDLCCAA
eukprot:1918962-Pyramimonas_sp.AAC.1